jgi:hypothetical protein
MKNKTAAAILFTLAFLLTVGTANASTVSKTQVYVDNADDDNLWITFYLDGKYMRGTIADSDSLKYVGYYHLSEGPHELKIEWKDPDICTWQEKTKTVDATGEDLIVTIGIEKNNESECVKTAQEKKTTRTVYGNLEVSVRNIDDDTLFISLFIDDERRRQRTVGKNTTVKLLKTSLRTGTYTLKIWWREPDTGDWYEKSEDVTVSEGDNYITLETEEVIYSHEPAKPSSEIKVYVENLDDDDLWVDVLVDSKYAIKYIRSGTKRYVRTFGKFYPGWHKVRLRWIDPDAAEWQDSGDEVYLGFNETISETYYTAKRTR